MIEQNSNTAEPMKAVNYRPTLAISDYMKRLMRPSDKNQPTRLLDRLICDRFEAEYGKEAPVQ